MTSGLVQRRDIWSHRPYQNLEEIGDDFRKNMFDDVTEKPRSKRITNYFHILVNFIHKPVIRPILSKQ